MSSRPIVGEYFSNNGALFYARDAQALADALKRALAEMPAKRPKSMKDVARHFSRWKRGVSP